MSNGFVNAGQVALSTAEGLQGMRMQRQQYDITEEQRQFQRDDRAAIQQEEMKRIETLKEGAALLESEDSLALAQWAIRNPKHRETFTRAIDLQDKFSSRPRLSVAKDVLSGRMEARTAYQARVEEIESKGGDASKLKEALNTKSDAELKSMAEKDVAMIDPKAYENYSKTLGGGDQTKVLPISMKDFTVESVAAYEQSGDKGDLVRFRSKTIDINGVPYQQDEITKQWIPVVDVKSGRVSDDAKAMANIEADKKSRVDFAEQQGEWRKSKSKYRSKIGSAKSSQKIMKATADEIKKNLNNWSTKHGASLSGLPGTQARKLKGLINTLKAHSAFTTLIDLKESGGSLGAISGSELVLLEAKLGALDQKGDNAEMIRVIDQILEASQSSITRLETAYKDDNAMYTSGFDSMIESQGGPSPEAPAAQDVSQDQQAIDWARANPDDPRAAQILQMQGAR